MSYQEYKQQYGLVDINKNIKDINNIKNKYSNINSNFGLVLARFYIAVYIYIYIYIASVVCVCLYIYMAS